MRNEILQAGEIWIFEHDNISRIHTITLVKRIAEFSTNLKDVWEVILENGEVSLCNLVHWQHVV